ncbi:LuxR C-terminal-related transcriptional regulator [Cryptosporangium sp. NPDC051539]|uniref:LuxR C-terminal-related transcriptional regulator n=1 Tax=Cryptosporangium sp. NPDC051539 TaxID=3363962 RepID=UPI0037B7434D
MHPKLAEAYAALLEHPNGDLADFAARLGVDESAARGLLDRLAAMSLVEEREREYVALSPLLAMQQLILRERSLMEQRQEFLRESYLTLTQLMPNWVDRRPGDAAPPLIEEITDLAAVRRRIEELAVGAQHELLALTPPARDPHASRAAARAVDRSVLDRGVVMRTVYPESIVEDAGAYAYAEELAAAGGLVRLCPSLPTRLMLVDRLVAVVPHEPQDGTRGCVILTHPGTVAALVSLFDAYWDAGRAVSAVVDDDECSAMERAVLRLLQQGMKDDAVARQMCLSVRTIRRCIADLMMRLDASSRFELGVGAVQRGWL